ncbi:hypothetical protein ABTW24_04385 [Sphingobacterium thalpophilum]|uniref:Lipid A core - O-antigen ligase and related enzymes n=1 Tax=Sphingobacterium thalpophilum TaxID=259 RepID=A0ABV4H9X8_9SPHI
MKANISLCLVWLTIFLAFPFSLSQAYGLPYMVLIPLFAMVLLAINFKEILISKIDVNIFAIIIAQILFAALWLIIHNSLAYINLMSQYFVALVVYCSIVAIGFDKFLTSFKRILVVMSICSLIIFLLGIFINIPFYEEFKNPDGRSNYNFIISFSNTVYDIGSVRLIRPSGFFDEPGSLSFYLVILLIINELYFKQTFLKYLIIICGCATLSIAFYIILIIYFLLNIKSWFSMRAFIATIGVCMLFLYFISKLSVEQETVLKRFTIDRLTSLFQDEVTSTGYNQGNNRKELIENAIIAVSAKPLTGLGLSYAVDPGSILYGKFMGANIIGIVGIHGIIGGTIFSLHLLYLIYICFRLAPNKLDKPKKMLILYLILLLQRPDYIGGILTYVAVIILIFSVQNYYVCRSKEEKLLS